MNIREITENIERQTLSKYACLSAESKGRKKPTEKCSMRTEYQRDRDKIIHSKYFRRLKHKTQVFIAPEGDYYRTRLTHTLEVSQIARSIVRALRLNEDLVEAMALGHDLGHTPFGHIGEKTLNELSPYGFKHYEQSLRIVDLLDNGTGLNLTWEVRDGIVNHTGSNQASTLEGKILKFADRIAYINHDIDDAIRGGVISQNDLPKHCIEILGDTHAKRIDTMITDIVESSMDKPEILMTEEKAEAMNELRSFLFENVYIGPKLTEDAKARDVVEHIYGYFMEHPEEIPSLKPVCENFELERQVMDYIVGMSDRYALFVYKNLFMPKCWDRY